MPAFAGDDAVAAVLPDQAGYAEAGAGAENDAWCLGDGLAGVQGEDVPVFNQRQAMCGSGEIVEQGDPADAESIFQRAGSAAGQVGQFGLPAIGRPGTPKQAVAMAGGRG
jgi:hypothetical protein